jgi:hypothetical protein
MKGDVIPDQHHVTRLCGGSHIREDGTIAATAFKPRLGEAFLSVNWLEVLALSDRLTGIEEICRVLGTKRRIGATAQLAILNVGQARQAVRMSGNNNVAISVLHEPETDPGQPQDLSHAGIYGVPADDNTVPELLAAAVSEVHQTRHTRAF